ncbi:glycosyltransferase [Lunatibacter salilacus]|uniref:glycosyltransferase n=1 Tax=Lunatibacter salilacus TaxID=2483804 RepID=UPI00131B4511|nr:glycosyltransferase [Lunatibacter salilacus]
MRSLIKHLVKLRNYSVFKKYDFLAKIITKKLPVDENANFVVSIASYPKRDHLLPAVFQALTKQTVVPKNWILVLSNEDYPNGLPTHLKILQRKGLEVLWVYDNPYAVKKLIPTIEKYPDLAVITFDDELIYGVRIIEKLIDASRQNKDAIIGHVGQKFVKINGVLNFKFRSSKAADLSTPSGQVYFLGGSGTYYPAYSLDERVCDIKAIHRIVPGRGSDIWFWAAAVAKGTKQICLGSKTNSSLYFPIPSSKETKPLDTPGADVMKSRFQLAIDYFGIREKLLEILPEKDK